MQQTRIRHWYLHYELKVSTILTMDEMPHSRVVYQHYILVGLQWWQCGHLPKLRVGLHIREDFFFFWVKRKDYKRRSPPKVFFQENSQQPLIVLGLSPFFLSWIPPCHMS